MGEQSGKGLRIWLLSIWVGGVAVLEVAQFRVMDCNEVPWFSILTGLPLFGALWGYPLKIVSVCKRGGSLLDKMRYLVGLGILAAGAVVAFGWLWLFSHMCLD